MNLNNEKLLIEGLTRGDNDAYKQLYKLYYSKLYFYLYAICGSTDVSKDIAQQVFIKIWNKRDSLSIKHSLKKYIFKIGYNLYIDLQKKNKKELQYLQLLKHETIIEIIEEPDDYLDQKINLILTEINKLPQQCKAVFLLAKKEGLKYKEISEELNISIKTVEKHMTKALNRLRKNVKDRANSLYTIIIHYLPNSYIKKQ